MVRGTTPTFSLTVPETVDLTAAANIYVTFATMDNQNIVTKTGDDLEVTEHQVDVFLSQEETLLFAVGKIKLQINWTYNDAGTVKRACTDLAVISVKPNLLGEVIS